jgi:hypothetical protein
VRCCSRLDWSRAAPRPLVCDLEQDFSTPQWRANCDRAISWERDPEKRAELLQRRA